MTGNEHEMPLISVLIPTRNENRFIASCLDSLHNLEYPKDRLGVTDVDGFSTDDSREIAQTYPVTVAMNPKQTEPAGRKLGLGLSRGYVIAFTDADCIVDRSWLRNALKYFPDEKMAGVGG